MIVQQGYVSDQLILQGFGFTGTAAFVLRGCVHGDDAQVTATNAADFALTYLRSSDSAVTQIESTTEAC